MGETAVAGGKEAPNWTLVGEAAVDGRLVVIGEMLDGGEGLRAGGTAARREVEFDGPVLDT